MNELPANCNAGTSSKLNYLKLFLYRIFFNLTIYVQYANIIISFRIFQYCLIIGKSQASTLRVILDMDHFNLSLQMVLLFINLHYGFHQGSFLPLLSLNISPSLTLYGT